MVGCRRVLAARYKVGRGEVSVFVVLAPASLSLSSHGGQILHQFLYGHLAVVRAHGMKFSPASSYLPPSAAATAALLAGLGRTNSFLPNDTVMGHSDIDNDFGTEEDPKVRRGRFYFEESSLRLNAFIMMFVFIITPISMLKAGT